VAEKRGYGPGRVALELGGVPAGLPFFAAGGDATADVVAEKLGTSTVRRKHVAGVRYTDILLTCGLDMGAGFWTWLADALASRQTPHDGALVLLDYDFNEVRRLTFQHALVTQIGFPALDAGSKDTARVAVRLSPELTHAQRSSGKASYGKGLVSAKQKKWLASNFRVTVPGLDLTKVSRVEALTVDVVAEVHAIGEARIYEQAVAVVTVPDVELTVPDSHAADLRAWHEDFVINGHNDSSHEKSGSIEMLSPDLRDVLLRLDLSGLGIYALADAPVEAGSEAILRAKAKLYCEEMRLATTPAASSGAAAAGAGSGQAPPPPSRAEEQTVDARSGVPIGLGGALAPPEIGLLGRDLGRLRPQRG
jgi:hypothetical protein